LSKPTGFFIPVNKEKFVKEKVMISKGGIMKKIISLIMMTIILGGVLPGKKASGLDPFMSAPKFKIKMTLEFKFGNPRHPDCSGFGICYIHIILGPQNPPEGLDIRQAYAEAYFDDDGHLIAEFSKSKLRNDTRNTYFKDIFLVEENYEIPQDILHTAQFQGSYTIKAGRYNITEDGDILRIRF